MAPLLFVGAAVLAVRTGLEPSVSALTLIPEILALAGVLLVIGAPIPRLLIRARPVAGTTIAFALRESGAVIGLVITLVTADLAWCLAYAALAVVAMALDFPTQRRIANWQTRSGQ